MDIDKLYQEAKATLTGRDRRQAGTSVCGVLRDALVRFCDLKRLTLAEGFDLALYHFLISGGIDFSEFRKDMVKDEAGAEPDAAPAEERPAWKLCNKCTASFRENQDTCPKCGAAEITVL